jgi:hypothetical protein
MSQMPPSMPPPAGPMSYQTPPPGAQANTGLAVGSMICGIASLVLSLLSFCIWFLSLPLGIVAVVLALIARGKIARGEAGGQGMVKAGLITGILGIVLSILIPVILYAGLRTAGNRLQQEADRIQREMEQQQRQNSTTAPAADTDTDTDTATETPATDQ